MYQKNYKQIKSITQPETITQVLKLSRPKQVSTVLGGKKQKINKDILFNEWFERMCK